MPKNYYIYSLNGKIKRQAINLSDIYPESYAFAKIPLGADTFATIITSDTKNKNWAGYMVKSLKTMWLAHDLWTNYYPDDYTMLSDAKLYWIAQTKYIESHIEHVTPFEFELLTESMNHAFCLAGK
jgi:hypothetical protein